jgi:hypothetical protein
VIAVVKHTPQTSMSTQDSTQPFAPAALQVTAGQLYGEYHRNEVAADQTYKDKMLAVSGIVESINKDFVDDAYLVLETANEFEGVQAHLKSSETSKAARMSKGELITVLCSGNGMIIGTPMLKDCVIQPSQQPEATNQQEQTRSYNLPADRSETPQEPTPVPVENSKPSAYQPAVTQEPKPLPAENPTPLARTPIVIEIDQQAIALWNQKRYSEAIPLLSQACKGRNANACYYLGVMFEFGQGVAQDFNRARNLYVDACNAGNQAACSNLSILMNYEPNSLLCKSTSLAFTVNQYRDSCNAGNGMSCDTLGHLYSYGCGVAMDTEKARQLYTKACTAGNQQGCGRLKEMQ